MAEGDPEYTDRARADLRALGKLTARSTVIWLQQWARGERLGEQVPLHHTDPDPRYVRLPGGMAAAFRMMRPHELSWKQRTFEAPLIVSVLPERVLAACRTEILQAILQAEDQV